MTLKAHSALRTGGPVSALCALQVAGDIGPDLPCLGFESETSGPPFRPAPAYLLAVPLDDVGTPQHFVRWHSLRTLFVRQTCVVQRDLLQVVVPTAHAPQLVAGFRDRRELKEVARNDELDATEGAAIPADELAEDVQLGEKVCSDHRDLVDHEDLRRGPDLDALFRAHDAVVEDGDGVLAESDAAPRMDGDSGDLQSCNASGRRDLEGTLEVLEEARNLLQEERFADTGGTGEEDRSAGLDLLEDRFLLVGAARVWLPDLRLLLLGKNRLILDIEAAAAGPVARYSGGRDREAEFGQALRRELFSLLLPVRCRLVLLLLPSLRDCTGDGGSDSSVRTLASKVVPARFGDACLPFRALRLASVRSRPLYASASPRGVASSRAD